MNGRWKYILVSDGEDANFKNIFKSRKYAKNKEKS
jgi:hypothetical protein